MKYILFVTLHLLTVNIYSQSAISLNSGAMSTNDLIYSVADVFVVPISDIDQSASGLTGAVSTFELIVTGIQEIISEGEMKIYPNPFSNSIFLESSNAKIKEVFIYNLEGKLILSKEAHNQKINLNELSSGMYIVEFDDKKIGSFRILKH